MAALEYGLEVKASIICLQEPCVSSQFSHAGWLIYWPAKGERANKRVAIGIRRDILVDIGVESREDLINHPYFLALDIWDKRGTHRVRRTRVINIYDNWLGEGNLNLWHGENTRRRRALEDANWDHIISGRTLILGDFNAHSPLWNPLIDHRISAGPLEDLVESQRLIINNEEGVITRPTDRGNLSIIDLTLSTESLGELTHWLVDETKPTGSDHATIQLEWEDLGEEFVGPSSSKVTGWRIQDLINDKEEMDCARTTWNQLARNNPPLSDHSTEEDVEGEAIKIEAWLTETLDQHASLIRLTPRSKRWWGPEVRSQRTQYAYERRQWLRGLRTREEHITARNTYYKGIRRAKRVCWEQFLTNEPEPTGEAPGDKLPNRCWLALKYTSVNPQGTTPSLVAPTGGPPAVSLRDKSQVIREVLFPHAPGRKPERETLRRGQWHSQISVDLVRKALFGQAIKKAPGRDRINFLALRALWQWDSPRIIALVRQSFRLGIHPQTWKVAKGILLKKHNKPDYTKVKAYRVICLLSCLGKVVEKIAAEALSAYLEESNALHWGQFGSRKQRSAIDAVAMLIDLTYKAWERGELMGTLLMDVKGAFDHMDPERLIRILQEAGVDGDIVRWVASFLTGRSVELLIDGQTCDCLDTESGCPQGSPVSPILFAIYIAQVLKEIEARVPGIICLCFADDIAILAPGTTVDSLVDLLEQAAETAIEWGQNNAVQFDTEKTEALILTRRHARGLKDQISSTCIQVGDQEFPFNEQPTRWLGVWLDRGLKLKTHYTTRLSQARKKEWRIRALCKDQGLPPGLARRVQVAAVQSTALYGSELWWKGQKDREDGLQLLINQQARSITGVMKKSPVGPLIREAALEPAGILLARRQQGYAMRLLSLPGNHPAKLVLPISFREGDLHAQPGEQPLEDRQWSKALQRERCPEPIGQRLAYMLGSTLDQDPSSGFEGTALLNDSGFPGQVILRDRVEAKAEALSHKPGLTIWSDGSRLESGSVGAGIAWWTDQGWQSKAYPMGKGKETFDAELLGILQALKLANSKGALETSIMVDSQAALSRIQHLRPGPGQEIAALIQLEAQERVREGGCISIYWTPGHSDIPGNEYADKAAKLAASRLLLGGNRQLSLAYIKRCRSVWRTKAREHWLASQLRARVKNQQSGLEYIPHKGWQQCGPAAKAPKRFAKRYHQLRTGHVALGAHLFRVQMRESPRCLGCHAPRETVAHALLECRQYRSERRTLYKSFQKENIRVPIGCYTQEAERILGDKRVAQPIIDLLRNCQLGTGYGELEDRGEGTDRLDNWGLDDFNNRAED